MSQNYALIACLGPDAQTFLQGQLSADLRQLTLEKGGLSCYLNLKGRVVALIIVLPIPGGFWLILPQDLSPIFVQKIKKTLPFFKASLEDITSQFSITVDLSPPEASPYTLQHDPQQSIFYLSTKLALHIQATPTSRPPLPLAFFARCIALRLPWIDTAQTEQFLPHDLDLIRWDAVSFNKGCYLGQEIVARMEYRSARKKTTEVFELPDRAMLVQDSSFEIVNEIETPSGYQFLVIRNASS